MKHKSTKSALLMSFTSLLLCFAMLIGSTFAWFTDSVTSGVNKIVAGNLDVELYHAKGTVTADDNNKVTSTTELFKVDRWEPGVVAYENFLVKNVGTLALKYQLAMTVGDFNKTVEGNHTLKEVLKVAVVPGGFTGTTRAAAQALTGYTTLEQFSTGSNGALLPGAAGDTFGVVIYWEPTNHDNDYNLNNGKKAVASSKFGETELGIELGIKLFATQLEHESDSFGPDYDRTATMESVYAAATQTVTETVKDGEDTVFTSFVTPSNEDGNTTKVTVPKEVASFVADSTSSMTVEATPTVAANNKFTVSTGNGAVGAIDLTVKVDGEDVSQFKDNSGNPVTVKVETYVAKNLTNVSLQYNDTENWTQVNTEAGVDAVGKVFYDKDTGRLVFKTTHFSTFVLGANEVAYVESNNTAYLTFAEAINAAQDDGDTITLLKDVTGTIAEPNNKVAFTIDKAITLDGNGKTITVTGDSASETYGIYVNNEDTAIQATIKNLTLNTTGTERAIRFGGKAGGTVKDVKITSEAVGIHVKGTGNVTIDNADITVNTISKFNAHRRAGVVVGAETTATMNNSKIVVNVTDRDKEDGNGWYLGKGAYVGNKAKGKLILNNTDITADFALAIDGSEDAGKLNNITVNSGTIKGDLGSPSGNSYKEIVINGGTFAPYSVNGLNGGFYGKDDTRARMEITGGTFSVKPDATKYIANGYTATESSGIWTVSKQPTNP